jgi:hypothetical protein
LPIYRVVNPHRARRRNKASTTRRKKRNPGAGEMLIMANPHRRQRRSNASPTRRRRRSASRASNPARRRRYARNHAMPYRRRRHSRNPNLKNMLTVAAWGSVGAVGTRAGTQLVLGASNTSWMGYAANLVAAYVLGYLGERFVGQAAGDAIAAGGGIATVLRIVSEQFLASSSLNQYLSLSGLGDAQFSVTGMGEYVNDPFAIPSISSGNNQLTQALLPPLVSPPAPAPTSGKGMHGLGASRWTPPWAR